MRKSGRRLPHFIEQNQRRLFNLNCGDEIRLVFRSFHWLRFDDFVFFLLLVEKRRDRSTFALGFFLHRSDARRFLLEHRVRRTSFNRKVMVAGALLQLLQQGRTRARLCSVDFGDLKKPFDENRGTRRKTDFELMFFGQGVDERRRSATVQKNDLRKIFFRLSSLVIKNVRLIDKIFVLIVVVLRSSTLSSLTCRTFLFLFVVQLPRPKLKPIVETSNFLPMSAQIRVQMSRPIDFRPRQLIVVIWSSGGNSSVKKFAFGNFLLCSRDFV